PVPGQPAHQARRGTLGGAAVAVGDGQADAVVAVVGRDVGGRGARQRGDGAAVGAGDGPGVGERVSGPGRVGGGGAEVHRAALGGGDRDRERRDRRCHVVDGHGEGRGGGQAVVVGGGDGHRGRACGAVGWGVGPVPGAGGVVLGHRAQRGGQRDVAAALDVVEGAAVGGQAAFVDGHGGLVAGDRRGAQHCQGQGGGTLWS